MPGRPRGFVRQSATSSVAAFAALLSGLLLDVVIAARFGAGRDTDAFFAASRIPIGITAILMTVAVQAWVPLLTRDRQQHGAQSMGRFASRLSTAVVLVGLVVWGLATVFARPLVSLTAPGLGASETHLAASIISPMYLLVPLVAAAEVVRGALNASFSFVVPAAMNLFMNGLAAGLILGYGGHDIHLVAWAYVAGAVLQLLVITALAWRNRVRVAPSIHLRDPRVRAAVRLTGRPTVSGTLNLANRAVESAIASFLPTGSITILSYGQRLISALGGGTFFRPITVTLLPRLSAAEHAGDRDTVLDYVYRALRLILAVSLPLTAFTVALADPVIRLVFHRGSFGPSATHVLALTLALYGLSLVGSGVQRVLLAPFFARLDTRTPLRNTAYGVLVDLALLLPCIAIFGLHSTHGVLGVAVAYTIDQYVIVAHAWWRLRGSVPVRVVALREALGCWSAAAAAGTGAMLLLVLVLDLDTLRSRPALLGLTAATALIGAVVMAAVALALGPPRQRSRVLRTVRAGRRLGTADTPSA